MLIALLALLSTNVDGNKLSELEKEALCDSLSCKSGSINVDKNICGIKEEDNGFRLKLFENECHILKYGCNVEKGEEYGVTNFNYCKLAQLDEVDSEKNVPNLNANNLSKDLTCEDDCSNIHNPSGNLTICAIRSDGPGFRLKIFENECYLRKSNCVLNLNFVKTDPVYCDDMELISDDSENSEAVDNFISKSEKNKSSTKIPVAKLKNMIVINGSILDFNGNINDTIDEFFASTHFLKLPIQEVSLASVITNETRRTHLLKTAGPVKVFTPWVIVPKNRTDDHFHRPTLSSCFHKCPEKCPATYAPVCGVPGIKAREPSLMFLNHCYMDKAQCKMFWENKSPTSVSSAYVESSFMFCLGDELNGLYRFLPLLRTLQHLGRLKKKGYYRYRVQNLKYLNNYLRNEPRLMG